MKVQGSRFFPSRDRNSRTSCVDRVEQLGEPEPWATGVRVGQPLRRIEHVQVDVDVELRHSAREHFDGSGEARRRFRQAMHDAGLGRRVLAGQLGLRAPVPWRELSNSMSAMRQCDTESARSAVTIVWPQTGPHSHCR